MLGAGLGSHDQIGQRDMDHIDDRGTCRAWHPRISTQDWSGLCGNCDLRPRALRASPSRLSKLDGAFAGTGDSFFSPARPPPSKNCTSVRTSPGQDEAVAPVSVSKDGRPVPFELRPLGALRRT
jgi:hypothetical protein